MFNPISKSRSKSAFVSALILGESGWLFTPKLPSRVTIFEQTRTTSSNRPTSVSSQLQRYVKSVQGAIQHFALAAISGSVGCAAVYPIDLVKTRMQNQKIVDGARMYKHSADCFMKVVRGEGFFGLYRGLGPQLIGVTPEKAMELSVNDLMRSLFLQNPHDSHLPLEIVAGGIAGGSQVLFTNPVEIIKIRLQIQGENIRNGLMKVSEKQSGLQIFRELGVRRLYSGASACLLRDVPFSAIFFSTYPRMKATMTSQNKPLSKPRLLLAGAICGIPASAMVTPFDVIKTRLQAKRQKGEVAHSGIRSCASHIWKTEGFSAFFKGAGARVCRSSPQFGVTLFVYELLQHRIFPDSKRA